VILVHLTQNERMSLNGIFSLAVTIFTAGQLAAQSASSTRTLVKAGRLLDPRSGSLVSPAAVLVENGKIKEVGSPSQVQSHASNDVKTIDFGSATSLPGLVDYHTLFLDIVVPPEAEFQRHSNRWQDRIGAIEAGKFADLIAVASDPVADITELERVRFVMKNAEVVRNDFASP
jgi:imidazolonepropionase-like amidohydrolase